MDAVENPFAPGAGSRPPELAGRDEIIANATIALKRVRAGRHAKSQMLLGLRGVGKTVLLNRIAEIAEEVGYLTAILEAPENRRLAEMLVPVLRSVLYKLSGVEQARVLANRAVATLRGFASAFKVRYGDFEIGVDAEPGLASSGDLETDLPELLQAVATAARAASRPVAIFIDEVQYLHAEDLRGYPESSCAFEKHPELPGPAGPHPRLARSSLGTPSPMKILLANSSGVGAARPPGG
jgi:hypothetical protein